jgi:hypothetical protein
MAIVIVPQDDDHPLEHATTTFHRTFTKSDHFKVGCAICILIQDNLLTAAQVNPPSPCHGSCLPFKSDPGLPLHQRLVGFSILCDLYRNESNGTNPFLPVFLDALEKGSDPCEKQFLVHLLCSPPSNRDVRPASTCAEIAQRRVRPVF